MGIKFFKKLSSVLEYNSHFEVLEMRNKIKKNHWVEIKTLHTKNELFGPRSGTSSCSKEPDFSFVFV